MRPWRARRARPYLSGTGTRGARPSLCGDGFDGASLGGAFALIFVEDFFAEAKVLRRRFDVFVRADVFEGAFEGHFQRGIKLDALAVTLGAHVGELFGFARIDGDVVFAGVFADDLSG